MARKQVVVIAGPTGSGKDSIIQGILARFSNCSRLVTATTRTVRPGEKDGVNYHFLSKEKFLTEMKEGNILEYNYRKNLDTYYGTYKPALEKQLASGKIIFAQVQIIGARYLKEHYGATLIFISPSSFETLEARIRERDTTLTEEELRERIAIARQEVEEDAKEYDYTIMNEQGKLSEAIDHAVEILRKEGYTLVR
jgi:guanylate kinase